MSTNISSHNIQKSVRPTTEDVDAANLQLRWSHHERHQCLLEKLFCSENTKTGRLLFAITKHDISAFEAEYAALDPTSCVKFLLSSDTIACLFCNRKINSDGTMDSISTLSTAWTTSLSQMITHMLKKLTDITASVSLGMQIFLQAIELGHFDAVQQVNNWLKSSRVFGYYPQAFRIAVCAGQSIVVDWLLNQSPVCYKMIQNLFEDVDEHTRISVLDTLYKILDRETVSSRLCACGCNMDERGPIPWTETRLFLIAVRAKQMIVVDHFWNIFDISTSIHEVSQVCSTNIALRYRTTAWPAAKTSLVNAVERCLLMFQEGYNRIDDVLDEYYRVKPVDEKHKIVNLIQKKLSIVKYSKADMNSSILSNKNCARFHRMISTTPVHILQPQEAGIKNLQTRNTLYNSVQQLFLYLLTMHTESAKCESFKHQMLQRMLSRWGVPLDKDLQYSVPAEPRTSFDGERPENRDHTLSSSSTVFTSALGLENMYVAGLYLSFCLYYSGQFLPTLLANPTLQTLDDGEMIVNWLFVQQDINSHQSLLETLLERERVEEDANTIAVETSQYCLVPLARIVSEYVFGTNGTRSRQFRNQRLAVFAPRTLEELEIVEAKSSFCTDPNCFDI